MMGPLFADGQRTCVLLIGLYRIGRNRLVPLHLRPEDETFWNPWLLTQAALQTVVVVVFLFTCGAWC